MIKYCAINLNARYRLSFKYSRDNTCVFGKKKKRILYSICICIDITLLRTVADDLLKCEKTEKWCLLQLTGRKAFVKGSHCSKFQSIKRASVKQLFTNHLGLRIISFTNLEIWKKWREKEMSIVQTFKKVQTIQKVNFIIKIK